jgi:hypothetical protein
MCHHFSGLLIFIFSGNGADSPENCANFRRRPCRTDDYKYALSGARMARAPLGDF